MRCVNHRFDSLEINCVFHISPLPPFLPLLPWKQRTIPSQIPTNQHPHAQIPIHLAHNLDPVAHREMRISVQVRGHRSVTVERGVVAAELGYAP